MSGSTLIIQLLSLLYKTPTYPESMPDGGQRIYGSELKEVNIVHRAGKESSNADALSRNPCGAAPTEGIGESEIQVSKVECDVDEVPVLLELEPYSSTSDTNRKTLATEQQKDLDHQVAEILTYLRTGALPKEER